MQRGLEGRSKAYSFAVAELSPVPARVLPIAVSYIALLSDVFIFRNNFNY